MAPRAGETVALKPPVEGLVDPVGAVLLDLLLLFAQRRVAAIAVKRRRRITLDQLDELPFHPGPHAPRVEAGPPVSQLGRVTDPAALRVGRSLDPSETFRRPTLRRDREPPVLAEKLFLADVVPDLPVDDRRGSEPETQEHENGQTPQEPPHRVGSCPARPAAVASQARRTSPTVQACAIHPSGRNGGSPSKISARVPRP